MDLKFDIDKNRIKRTWLHRFFARQVVKMIIKSDTKTYQFIGYTGFKRDRREMVDADKYQLAHWILREAGYLCYATDIKKRFNQKED